MPAGLSKYSSITERFMVFHKNLFSYTISVLTVEKTISIIPGNFYLPPLPCTPTEYPAALRLWPYDALEHSGCLALEGALQSSVRLPSWNSICRYAQRPGI